MKSKKMEISENEAEVLRRVGFGDKVQTRHFIITKGQETVPTGTKPKRKKSVFEFGARIPLAYRPGRGNLEKTSSNSIIGQVARAIQHNMDDKLWVGRDELVRVVLQNTNNLNKQQVVYALPSLSKKGLVERRPLADVA
tara:strand:- start:33 stop:449 length:417 start_codon:yes stop_codon:yes gene_type:complete